MRAILSVLSAGLLLSACNLKPTNPSDELGAQVQVKDVQSAIDDAQAGFNPQTGFNVGDSGTIVVVDQMLNQSAVQATHDFQVTQVTNTQVTYNELVRETGQITTNVIDKADYDGTQISRMAPWLRWIHLMPASIEQPLKSIAFRLQRFFDRIQIAPSTSFADSSILPHHTLLKVRYANNVDKAIERSFFSQVSGEDDTSPTPTPTTSPIPFPSTTPSPTDDTQYYGLVVTHHFFRSPTCTGIPNCMLPSVHIEFNEIYSEDGQPTQVHNTYEISTQVPGLFLVLQRCLSSVVVQDGNPYPFTECAIVSSFSSGVAAGGK